MFASPERFELSRGNPMYLAGTRLNHSAKATLKMPSSKKEQRSGQGSVKMDDAGVGVAGRETEADEPRDARVVRELLRSMGIGDGEYEPRVLHQFLELCYRYVVDVLSDAQVYAEHAGKNSIDPDDVRLAIQSKINFSFSQPPPREVLLELARTRNKTPLPKTIAPPGSIPLPPEQDTLVSPNYQLLIPRKQPAQIEETEEDEDGTKPNPNPNTNSNPNSSVEQRTDAEQQQMQAIPQKVSFALASSAAPAAKRQRC